MAINLRINNEPIIRDTQVNITNSVGVIASTAKVIIHGKYNNAAIGNILYVDSKEYIVADVLYNDETNQSTITAREAVDEVEFITNLLNVIRDNLDELINNDNYFNGIARLGIDPDIYDSLDDEQRGSLLLDTISQAIETQDTINGIKRTLNEFLLTFKVNSNGSIQIVPIYHVDGVATYTETLNEQVAYNIKTTPVETVHDILNKYAAKYVLSGAEILYSPIRNNQQKIILEKTYSNLKEAISAIGARGILDIINTATLTVELPLNTDIEVFNLFVSRNPDYFTSSWQVQSVSNVFNQGVGRTQLTLKPVFNRQLDVINTLIDLTMPHDVDEFEVISASGSITQGTWKVPATGGLAEYYEIVIFIKHPVNNLFIKLGKEDSAASLPYDALGFNHVNVRAGYEYRYGVSAVNAIGRSQGIFKNVIVKREAPPNPGSVTVTSFYRQWEYNRSGSDFARRQLTELSSYVEGSGDDIEIGPYIYNIFETNSTSLSYRPLTGAGLRVANLTAGTLAGAQVFTTGASGALGTLTVNCSAYCSLSVVRLQAVGLASIVGKANTLALALALRAPGVGALTSIPLAAASALEKGALALFGATIGVDKGLSAASGALAAASAYMILFNVVTVPYTVQSLYLLWLGLVRDPNDSPGIYGHIVKYTLEGNGYPLADIIPDANPVQGLDLRIRFRQTTDDNTNFSLWSSWEQVDLSNDEILYPRGALGATGSRVIRLNERPEGNPQGKAPQQSFLVTGSFGTTQYDYQLALRFQIVGPLGTIWSGQGRINEAGNPEFAPINSPPTNILYGSVGGWLLSPPLPFDTEKPIVKPEE